jgi:AcrR family transcriptional regulator
VTKIRDRDQIVDAAARLFTAKGFEATSLDDIASDLGTARSALYYHVSGKAELRALVQIKRVGMLVDDVAAVANSPRPAVERLAGIVRAHLNHFARFYPESRMWSTTPSAHDAHDESGAALHQRMRHVVRHLRAVIEDGVAAGEFRRTDTAVAALGIIGMCNYVTTWYRSGGPRTIEEIAAVYAEMAVGSLRA